MENIFGLTTCVAIVVIAYLIGIAVKNIEAIDDKWIPVICGIVGAPLGVLALRIVPDFPATDYLTAVAVGIVSGLAATGINQVFKQLKKDEYRTGSLRYGDAGVRYPEHHPERCPRHYGQPERRNPCYPRLPHAEQDPDP